MSDQQDNLEEFRKQLEEDIRRFDTERPEKRITAQKDSVIGSADHSHSHRHSSTSAHHRSHVKHKPSKRHHHRHRRKKRIGVRILCAIFAIVLVLGVGGYGLLQWELGRIQRNGQDTVTTEEIKDNVDTDDAFGLGKANASLLSDPNITNILLIGQDRRTGDKAEMRSDAMIVCSINSKTKEISLTSLMRDMYLPIPEYGYGPLNSTYLIGGFDLLNETIEKNFGISIAGDIEVDFERFMELMDIIGPLDINITDEEATYLNNMQGTNWAKQSGSQNAGAGLSAGINSMNSKQLLLYCRMRHNIGGDWGRTDRQRKVIMASFNKLKKSGGKTVLSFAHQALPLLTTNLTNTAIIKWAYALTSYKMDVSQSHRIPYEGSYTQEIKEETLHVLVPDIVKNRKAVQQYIYGNN